jgi:hypothetical protein
MENAVQFQLVIEKFEGGMCPEGVVARGSSHCPVHGYWKK